MEISATKLRRDQALIALAIRQYEPVIITRYGRPVARLVFDLDAEPRKVTPVTRSEFTRGEILERVAAGEVFRIEDTRGRYVVGYLVPPKNKQED